MKGFDSKSRFSEINSNSHYLRVDETHPLELLVGLNETGQKTLRYIGHFERVRVKGTKIIEVSHHSLPEGLSISFLLVDRDFNDLFFLLCNDLVDSGRSIRQEDGYVYIVNRFEKWKSFIGQNRRFLSEIEIRGLIGELLFMNDTAMPTYGISRAIQGWSGPEPAKKDFSFDDTWYEVKTAASGKITISSIDQLDSDVIGHLVVYSLEKMSPEYHGLTLNVLVEDIMAKIEIDHDRSDFIMKLVHTGYYQEDYYDDFVYSRISSDCYLVDEMFPYIHRSDIPDAVDALKYDIILNLIDHLKEDFR